MVPRPVLYALVACAMGSAACRRTATQLDDVPRLAYSTKPAVVRVNAYATATFRYPVRLVESLANELELPARDMGIREGAVETGAGGSGSGFIIRPDGFVLTSGHVVAPTRERARLESELRRNGAIAALVRHLPIEELRSLKREEGIEKEIVLLAKAGTIERGRVVNQVEFSDGKALKFEVVQYSPDLTERGADLALLRVDRQDLPALPLGEDGDIRVGDAIWTIGYPSVASSNDEVIGGWLSRESDLEATFNLGSITAIKRDVANHPVLQSNVAIYHGNSGGPAVDSEGRVVGVATWGHSNAEQIKFLVPVAVVKKFLSGAGVTPNAGGEFNRSYNAALEAAKKGRWTDARSELDAAAKLFPNSPDVARFSADIDKALAVTPWWRLHPVAASLSGIFLLGVLAVGSMAFSRKSLLTRAPDSSPFETVLPSARDDDAGQAVPRMLGRFTILNGSRAGERLGLGGTGIRIGRERAICEIVLENPKISRLHAEVVSMDGKVLLIDRNSSNGTYVNDQKIDRRVLKDGDIIYFGGRNAIAVAFHV